MVDKYILVSLDEKKSKDIANVISNDTSRRILDFLGENDKVAPVEISKKLSIPISTITYNLKHLREQGLIESKDFAWSDKGKKVELYSLARKLIIIAPKGFDWKDSIKKILPVALVGAVGTAMLGLFSKISLLGESAKVMGVQEASMDLAEEAAMDMAAGSAPTVSQMPLPYWLFFLIFVIIILGIMLLIQYRRTKK